MKHFLIRLAIYIPIISFFYSIFVPGFFNPEPFPGPIVAQAISHITAYAVAYGFWIAIYELCYRGFKAISKPKPLPVPETQPLPAIQQASNPTTPINNP